MYDLCNLCFLNSYILFILFINIYIYVCALLCKRTNKIMLINVLDRYVSKYIFAILKITNHNINNTLFLY